MDVAARIGKVLAGKYHIDAPLGRGAVGLMFAATHRLTQEQVVVKFVREERLGDEQTKRRFVKEAQIAASLKHPNVVRLIDLEEDKELGLYMVLELLQGESLQERLVREQRIALPALCEILFPVMHAISDAHARDILHRDLKPSNIFLHRERDGRTTPKLLDFGLVPPQRGEGLEQNGPPTDVRSMAAAIYECLSGKAPVGRAKNDGGIPAVATDDYTPLPECCPELPRAAAIQAVLSRALSIEPAQRTASMAQLMTELGAVAEIDPGPVLAAHGLRWKTPSDRVERASRASQPNELAMGDLASLPPLLDPSQLPPPRNFQRITTGLAIALFVIAAMLVGSSFRRTSPPSAQGGVVPAEAAGRLADPAPKKSGDEDELDLSDILVEQPTTR